MGVSINWLKDYVDFKWTAEELAHRLTMAGIAIEGIDEEDGDYIMDLDLTPNRGDCLGMINIAREVAALNGNKVKIPEINLKENDENINNYIKVLIKEPELCPRYTARMIKNVKIGPSPEWMQERLIHSGIRPINNVVDITNYVLLESNQPLHAFDYELLGPAKKIVVRRAEKGEKFTTLDEVERELNDEMLLITDSDKAVALAGIMGGMNTEINDNTTNVLLESAAFHGSNIRRTGRRLALRSDSSMRFEKGSDINGVIYAINRAAQLIQDIAGGEVVAGICDVYPETKPPRQIALRPERVNYLLGIEIDTEEIRGYLQSLNFTFSEENGNFKVEAPTYRPDLEMEVDLIEEVARLYGYDRIPSTLAYGDTTQGGMTPYQKFQDRVKNLLARNMYEVMNYSFITPRFFDMLCLPEESELRNVVKIANPLSEEQSVMRTLLLGGMLDTLGRNLSRKNNSLAFFEMGSVFYPVQEGQPEERLKLSGIVAGKQEVNWLKNTVDMDFYYLKGILENFFYQLGINDVKFTEVNDSSYHPGRSALIKSEETELGVIGELHPRVRQNYDIKPRACAFELDMLILFNLSNRRVMMEEITRYPAMERDLAIIVEQDLKALEIKDIISGSAGEYLQEIQVFDIYEGEQVPEGKKSIAFRIIFQSSERTLTDAEVNESMDNILRCLQEKVQAVLR